MPRRGKASGKAKAERITNSAFGRRHRVSHTAVAKGIKSGRLRESVRDGKIVNLALADREWLAGASKPANGGGKGHAPAVAEGGTLVQAQLRLADQRAASLELANQRKRGEYLLAADVERDHFQAARTLRDRILNVPDRLAELPEAVRNRIRDELRLALGEVADELVRE